MVSKNDHALFGNMPNVCVTWLHRPFLHHERHLLYYGKTKFADHHFDSSCQPQLAISFKIQSLSEIRKIHKDMNLSMPIKL